MSFRDSFIQDDFLSLVQKIAGYRHFILISANVYNFEKDELINVGYFGLVKAYNEFDPLKSNKSIANDDLKDEFEKFAKHYINNAISAFLRERDPLDFRVRKKVKDMVAAIEFLEQKLGRRPVDDEIAGQMGIDVEKLLKLKSQQVYFQSIDDPVFLQTPIEEEEIEPDADKRRKKLEKDIDHCLKTTLDKNEILIVLLYNYRNFTLKDIAEILGDDYNISRVRNINIEALRILRDCLDQKNWQVIDMFAIS